MLLPSATDLALTAAILALGALGGALMQALGAPLPYMLGSLLATALLVSFGQRQLPAGYVFPQRLRMLFVGVIGTMIGAQLTPEVAALLPSLGISLPAVALFVLGAHALNFAILHRVGGFDRSTAYYAGAPGGLMEAITFGEEAGADIRLLTLMQFLRIIVVVTLVPIGISLWEGAPVGSAAGLSFEAGGSGLADVPLVIGLALAGVWLGLRLKLPAGQLMGPLVLAGALSLTGVVPVAAPGWLAASAQVVLGAGLGMRFIGMTGRLFVRGMGLSLLSVAAMMALGLGLALPVHALGGLPLDMLVVSFAPGGVVEMGLIALSLAANPAIVTLHHLVRILLTVAEMAVVRAKGWI